LQFQVVVEKIFAVPGVFLAKNHLELQNISRKAPVSATT
jgi:hypothetical protein